MKLCLLLGYFCPKMVCLISSRTRFFMHVQIFWTEGLWWWVRYCCVLLSCFWRIVIEQVLVAEWVSPLCLHPLIIDFLGLFSIVTPRYSEGVFCGKMKWLGDTHCASDVVLHNTCCRKIPHPSFHPGALQNNVCACNHLLLLLSKSQYRLSAKQK